MALSGSEVLPVIDFSRDAMKPGTITWDLTCGLVRKALEEYGCFKATFRDVTFELYTALFRSLEELFDLPKDAKRRFTSDVPFDGYISDMPITPLLEAAGIADPLRLETIEKLTLALWPEGHPTFCETLHSYATRVSELERTVREMIFESFEVDMKAEEAVKYSVRVMKYGAPMKDEDTLGGVAHFDMNLITILQEDGVGLQVRTKDGQWVNATPSGSSLIVMIGESFHGWSNGRLHCPLHRVRVSGSKARYSIGVFASKEGAVEIPKELVDEQHPIKFKPFDQSSVFQVFMGRIMEKAYTGEDDTIIPIVASHFAL